MKNIERFKKYRDIELDVIMLKIRNGTIKCGRYSHLVKVDKNFKVNNLFVYEDINDKKNKGDDQVV